MNKHTLFIHVYDYYTDLVAQLRTARAQTSMTYLSFDRGEWAGFGMYGLHSPVAFWLVAIVGLAGLFLGWLVFKRHNGMKVDRSRQPNTHACNS